MSEAGVFRPLHLSHAIEQVSIQIVFDSDLPDEEFSPVARWQALRLRLVDQFPLFNQEQGLRMVHTGTAQARLAPGIVANQFARIGPDGSPTQLLRAEPRSIAFTSSGYTRWANVSREAMRLFQIVADERYFPFELCVSEVALQYGNRFIWEGPLEALNSAFLLRRDSPWLISRIFQCSANWHCHIGEFQKLDAATRRLIQVNTAAVSQQGLKGTARSIVLQVVLGDALNTAGYKTSEPMTPDQSKLWVGNRLNDLHKSEKLIVSEILLPTVQDQISLEAGDDA